MKYIDADGVEFATPATFTEPATFIGALDLSDATLTPPANQFAVKRFVSQQITEADFTSGTSKVVALTGEPTAMIPIAAYVLANGTVSGTTDTTGLTVKLGTAGDDDGYMQAVSVFGAGGRKEGLPGVMLGGYRSADALQVTFTASGGDPDVVDITGLRFRAVVLYLEVSAES